MSEGGTQKVDYIEREIDGHRYLECADGRIIWGVSGGEGEGDPPTAVAPVPVETPPSDAPTSAAATPPSDTGATPDAKGPVPYDRFHAVNTDLGKYKELGSAEQITKWKADAERLATAEEQYRQDQAREHENTEAGRAAKARASAFRGLMDEAYGDGTASKFDQFLRAGDMQKQAHGVQGLGILREEMTKAGLNADDEKLVAGFEPQIEAVLNADPTLNAQYWNPATQPAALKAAFERVIAPINAALRAQGAATLREAAARAARTITPARAGSATPVEAKPVKWSSDPVERQRQSSTAIDEIFAAHGL